MILLEYFLSLLFIFIIITAVFSIITTIFTFIVLLLYIVIIANNNNFHYYNRLWEDSLVDGGLFVCKVCFSCCLFYCGVKEKESEGGFVIEEHLWKWMELVLRSRAASVFTVWGPCPSFLPCKRPALLPHGEALQGCMWNHGNGCQSSARVGWWGSSESAVPITKGKGN